MYHEIVPSSLYVRNVMADLAYDHEFSQYESVPGVMGAPAVYVSIFGGVTESWAADPGQSTYIDFIPFDFDSPFLAHAQRDAADFIRHVQAVYDVEPEYLPIFFSGAKGFHVYIPTSLVTGTTDPLEATPEAVRAFARQLAGDIPSFDAAIYDQRRIFRIPGAVNSHSGLRKIQIEFRALLHSEPKEIKAWAAESAPAVFPIDRVDKRAPYIEQAWIDAMALGARQIASEPDGNPNRPGTPTFRTITAHPDEEGSRNQRASRLCAMLTNTVHDPVILQWVMGMWNRLGAKPLPEQELAAMVSRIYRRYHNTPTTNRRR